MIATLLLTTSLSVGQPPQQIPARAVPQPLPTAMPAAPVTAAPKIQAPAPVVPATPAPAANGSSSNGTPKDEANKEPETPKDEEKKEEEKPPTKYFLERTLGDTVAGRFFTDHGIKVYGWTAMSYTGSSASQSNLPMALNDRANFFQLNQNYLVIEKPVDTAKKEVQFGFQTDYILPGTDARYTVGRGLFDGQLRQGANGGTIDYPIDIFQMYGTVFLPNIGEGTTVKIGRFATPIGYETVQAITAPFFSNAYLFQYNPFTHTGLLATTQLSDDWTLTNGLVLGADNFIDPASRLTYLGGVKWAPKEGKSSLAFNTMITRPRYNQAEAYAFYNLYELLYTRKLTDKLNYVADAIYSHMEDFPGVDATAQWYGLAQYLSYQHSEKLTSAVRMELFQDDQGVRTGTRGLYTAVTYGMNWTPCDDLLIRPFARYDFNKNGPFEGKQNLYTGGIEAVVRW